MPVSIFLTESQLDTFSKALKQEKVEVTIKGRQLILTRENVVGVRQSINNLLKKKLAVKTRTVENFEICFNCQQLLRRIDSAAVEFAKESEEDVVVDSTSASDVVTESETDWGKDVGKEVISYDDTELTEEDDNSDNS